MKKPKASPIEAVKTSFPQLAEETNQLNQALEQLGKNISGVETSLRRIGLNVSAWHHIAGGHDENSGYSWSRDIGYTRINNLWHIALRESDQGPGEEAEQTTYKFENAPPWMCLEAAGKVPELIQELIARTHDMRAQITAKNTEIEELATVLDGLATDIINARG